MTRLMAGSLRASSQQAGPRGQWLQRHCVIWGVRGRMLPVWDGAGHRDLDSRRVMRQWETPGRQGSFQK